MMIKIKFSLLQMFLRFTLKSTTELIEFHRLDFKLGFSIGVFS